MASDLLIKLLLKDEASKKMTEVEKQIQHLQNTTKKWVTALTTSASALAIAAIAKEAVQAAADQEMAIRRLSIAVENAGYSWDKTGNRILDFTKNLQRTTVYSENETIKVFQQLITYTRNIDEAMRGTTIALDITSSGFMDMDTAAKAIGKAFEGDVAALGKLLPELKTANNEQLKNMTAAQKTTYALDLLQQKFGGMAEGEVKTFTGATTQLGNAWGDFLKSLGDFVVKSPEATTSIDFLTFTLDNLAQTLAKIREEREKKNPIFNIEEWLPLTTSFPNIGGMLGNYFANKGLKAGENFINVSSEIALNPQATETSGLQDRETLQQQFLQQEANFWNQKAQLVLQGDELIKSIESSYGDWKKDLLLQDKLFFVQNELEKVDLLLNTAKLDEETQTKLLEKKRVLKIAETNLEKAAFKEILGYQLQMMNSFGQITSDLAQITGQAWLDVASIMITSFADAIQTIIEMELVKAWITGQWWKVAAGAASLAAIVSKAAVGLANIQKQQDALRNQNWVATIPAMAEGGVVDKPTIALIGERGPEAVVPLTGNNRIGSSKSVTINFDLSGSTFLNDDLPKAIKRNLSEYIQREIAIGSEGPR